MKEYNSTMSESAASRALLTASPYPFGGVSVAVSGGSRRSRRHSRRHRGGATEPAPVQVKVGGAEVLEDEEELEGGKRHRRHSRRHTKKGGKRHHKKRHTRKHY